MIQKLINDHRMITLGENTVFSGNAYHPNEEKPFGIYFSNTSDMTGEAVFIHFSK